MYNNLSNIISLLGYSIGICMTMFFIIGIATIVGAWKTYEKAERPGWSCLIPFYSNYIEYDMVWDVKYFWYSMIAIIVYLITISVGLSLNGNFFVGVLTAVSSIVFYVLEIIKRFKFGKAFGKDIGLGLLMVFIPLIAYLYIGFSSDVQYVGK